MKKNTESWNIKKAEFWRTDAFKLWCWCWRRLLKLPRRSNQSVLKEINPEYSMEGLMLKLKLQYFGHMMWRAHWKRPWWWERLRAGGEGAAEDEMVGWHYWLNGHEFEQMPEDNEGQRSLACCSPWDQEQLDWTKNNNNKKTV